METKIILLRLYLDELGVDTTINTKDQRIILQKAVYLGQAAGGDLGYRYSWYINGPYSSELTRDYYKLAEELNNGTQKTQYVLRDDLKERLHSIKDLLNCPREWSEGQAVWLELIASLDYAVRVLRMNKPDAKNYVVRHKPHLEQYMAVGLDALERSPLQMGVV